MGVGFLSVGLNVFSGIDELVHFGRGALHAQNNRELDEAAARFANAVSILGVQAIVGLLLKRAPRTFRARGPVAPPRSAPGFYFRPGLRSVRTLGAGTGETSWFGEISISRFGTSTDRRLAALHESFHRALMPKLDILRQVRVEGRAASYHGSALITYLEETIAETYAQVSVHGIRDLLTGIVFPVKNGYVTLFAQKVINNRTVLPVVPEAAGMFLGVVNAHGWIWMAYHSLKRPD